MALFGRGGIKLEGGALLRLCFDRAECVEPEGETGGVRVSDTPNFPGVGVAGLGLSKNCPRGELRVKSR